MGNPSSKKIQFPPNYEFLEEGWEREFFGRFFGATWIA